MPSVLVDKVVIYLRNQLHGPVGEPGPLSLVISHVSK